MIDLPARDRETGDVVVVVETPKGSRHKYKYDPEDRALRLGWFSPRDCHFRTISDSCLPPGARMAIRWTCCCFWRHSYRHLQAMTRRASMNAFSGSLTHCGLSCRRLVFATRPCTWLCSRPMRALCSVSDATRDALLSLFRQRFSQRIATATTEEALRARN